MNIGARLAAVLVLVLVWGGMIIAPWLPLLLLKVPLQWVCLSLYLPFLVFICRKSSETYSCPARAYMRLCWDWPQVNRFIIIIISIITEGNRL